MDVDPMPIQSIFPFRDAPQRRKRRKNRSRKREDPRSQADRDGEHAENRRLDLLV